MRPARWEAQLSWRRYSRHAQLRQRPSDDSAVSVLLLVSGDTFLRRLVEVLPRFSSKRQAVDISQQIESDVSAYLLTISIMNAAVGVATGWLCG